MFDAFFKIIVAYPNNKLKLLGTQHLQISKCVELPRHKRTLYMNPCICYYRTGKPSPVVVACQLLPKPEARVDKMQTGETGRDYHGNILYLDRVDEHMSVYIWQTHSTVN